VAGPTCDSDDAFGHDEGLVQVPAELKSGDPVWILSCGAYAASYTTQGFNGIDPLPHEWVRSASPIMRPISAGDWARIAEIEHETYAPLGLSEGIEALRGWGRLSPETCFVLEVDGGIAGYVLAGPHPAGSVPELGRPPAANASGARTTNLHLHDLTLARSFRGNGLAKLALRRLEREAAARAFASISLVAVGGSAGFWAASGFAPRADVDVSEGYGTQSTYMSKATEVDQLAAHP
jgi:ornithine decarboxylase